MGLFPLCLSIVTPYTSGSLVELSLAGQNLPSWSINILRPSLRSPPWSCADLSGSMSSWLTAGTRSAFTALVFISLDFLCLRLWKEML